MKRSKKIGGGLMALCLCLWAQGLAGQDGPPLAALRDSFRQAVYFQQPQMLALASRYDSLARLSGDAAETARGQNFLGMAHWKLGQVDEAIPHYLDALGRYRALGDSLYAGIVLNNIAAAYKERGKPEETIAYYRQALQLFTAISDSLWIANVSLNLAHLYNDTERFAEADEASLRALAYFEALRDSPMIMNALISAGGQPFKQNRFAEALTWYEKALVPCQKFGTPEDSAVLLSNMGYARAKLGDFSGGEALLLRSAEVGQRLGLRLHLKKVFLFLTLIYEEQGQFEKAFYAQKRYMALSDSLFSSEKDERMLEMLQKYEASEKERKIQALNAENQLRRRRQQFTLLGLGFALSLAAALLYLYFSKQKSNRLLAEKNALITRALSEKEALLREIHHRVKNNLQVISSLLSLQSKHVQDEGALRALQEGRSRVGAMSLIHQHLYLEQHPTAIHLPTYVGQLSEKLFSAYSLDPSRVELALEVEDLLLDVDTAIPLGLILNELVTNALKYAFNGAEAGRLEIGLRREEGALKLRVSDNGPGFPAGFDWRRSESFGFRLLQAFSKKLKGEIFTGNGPGAWVELRIHAFQPA
jgi:two-component sensor histidine kinase